MEGTERIGQVATISANGEKEVGKLLAEAMDRVTKVYYYMSVLILVCVLILLCVLLLLYMCPHLAIYLASAYYCICVGHHYP